MINYDKALIAIALFFFFCLGLISGIGGGISYQREKDAKVIQWLMQIDPCHQDNPLNEISARTLYANSINR